MERSFLQEELEAVKTQIRAYRAAMLALSDGVQMYKLDTGQSIQQVTMVDLPGLQRTVDALWMQYQTLCARLNGNGTYVRPAW